MFWGNKCPHKFLPRDFGTERASSNVRDRMFLVGLTYPGLAKIKKEWAEHTMASVVELSLGTTFSHSCIQLGFISSGHFGWFFSERNHIKVTLGRSFPRMWCGYVLPSAPMVRTEGSRGESTCIPRSQRHLTRSILVLLRNMACLWNEGNHRGIQENPSCILLLNLLESPTHFSWGIKPTQPPV